jgi:hypothetical protein
MRLVCILFILAVMLAVPPAARAQESREAVIAAEQAEKAKRLAPYVPSRAEQFVIDFRRRMVEAPNGFYPFFGSVYSGGGFTLGTGYRRFYGDNTQWNIRGLYSLKQYKFIELSTDSLQHADGRLNARARVGWRDATQVAFYGIGPDTANDRTNFRLKQAYFGGDLEFRPVPLVVLAGTGLYEDYTLERGKGSSPSIEQVFTPATTPGLGANPTYLRTTASAAIDSRPVPGYARRGGLYQLTYQNYADRADTFSFDRLDADVVQHIPILRETWVISLRGAVQTTLHDSDIVPYFLMPSLGSGSTLRGYDSWRFRDRHSMLMTAEWRWIPSRLALDMAIFYDTGKVARSRNDLSFSGLKSDAGVGVRFHGPFSTPLRVEIAKGSEGFQLVFAGSAAF